MHEVIAWANRDIWLEIAYLRAASKLLSPSVCALSSAATSEVACASVAGCRVAGVAAATMRSACSTYGFHQPSSNFFSISVQPSFQIQCHSSASSCTNATHLTILSAASLVLMQAVEACVFLKSLAYLAIDTMGSTAECTVEPRQQTAAASLSEYRRWLQCTNGISSVPALALRLAVAVSANSFHEVRKSVLR